MSSRGDTNFVLASAASDSEYEVELARLQNG